MVVGRRPAAASVYTTWSLSVRGLYRCVHSQKGLISCLKDDRRSVVNPSVVAGSERRSTARQIVSKFIEFVCPSSTRHLSALSPAHADGTWWTDDGALFFHTRLSFSNP